MHCSKPNHDLTVNSIIDSELCTKSETAFNHSLDYPLYIVQKESTYVRNYLSPVSDSEYHIE